MRAEYVDHMGDDLRVVNAARVSFDKESDWEYAPCTCAARDEVGCVCGAWSGAQDRLKEADAKLIRYLANHNHWTPFAHPQITLRETVPIFVARQRFKHMVGFTYNEVSRRYVDDTPEFFRPSAWRLRPEDSVKQGSSDEAFTGYLVTENDELGGFVDRGVEDMYEDYLSYAQSLYTTMIDKGIAPEQARMVLPQAMYTSYYVTGSLAAWARAYKQRIEASAQKEIQDLAKQWGEVIEPLFPVSWKALTGE